MSTGALIGFGLFVCGTMLLLEISMLQILSAKKQDKPYDREQIRSSLTLRKLTKILTLLSIFPVTFWFLLVIKSWSGWWSLILLLFGVSIPIVIFSTYYYHDSYCKQYEHIKPK